MINILKSLFFAAFLKARKYIFNLDFSDFIHEQVNPSNPSVDR